MGQIVDRAEQRGVRLIADGVDGDLKPVHRRAAHQVAELRLCEAREPACLGTVGIRRFQPCPAGAERAVHVKLHAAEPQPVGIKPRRGAGAADQQRGVHASAIGHDPDKELIGVPGAAEGLPVLNGGAHIGHCGQPAREEQTLGSRQREIMVAR
jgi:hypothetical protein